jgi:hypothetical protein
VGFGCPVVSSLFLPVSWRVSCWVLRVLVFQVIKVGYSLVWLLRKRTTTKDDFFFFKRIGSLLLFH